MSVSRPKIAVSLGDPAGIGSEVVAKALADPKVSHLAEWIVISNARFLPRVKKLTGVSLRGLAYVRIEHLDYPKTLKFTMGKVDLNCGRAAVEYVRKATRMCLQGQAQAIVTAPINKEAVSLSYPKFSGHTEFIAELRGVKEPRMMLAGSQLRVIHVSTHVSLRDACHLNSQKVLKTIELGHEALQTLGFARPRIAVCGLNPHAGENGSFGTEDIRFVEPAVKRAQKTGICCRGPLPADTTFLKAHRGSYDPVVAMYHDQGHVPRKLLNFE